MEAAEARALTRTFFVLKCDLPVFVDLVEGLTANPGYPRKKWGYPWSYLSMNNYG
jgi:hypothetical protein